MWRIGIVFDGIDPIDFRRINRMALDASDCDTKQLLGAPDVCVEKCSYFALCTKQKKIAKPKKGGLGQYAD
jgi:hypothetical protein